MSQRPRKKAHYTYRDYLGWPDTERWELIRGAPWLMSPAPGLAHQTISTELLTQIALHLRDRPCRVFHAPFDVRLPRSDEADESVDTVVQPDIAVVCDEGKLDQRGCRGAPDWIVEIVSPGTAARDQIDKLALYEQHGVSEYWIVHSADRVVTVYRREGEAGYGRPHMAAMMGTLAVGVLPELIVDWEWVLNKLP